VVAGNMELLNAVADFDDASPPGRAVVQEALEAMVATLSPIIPHLCHELWFRARAPDAGHRRAVAGA